MGFNSGFKGLKLLFVQVKQLYANHDTAPA